MRGRPSGGRRCKNGVNSPARLLLVSGQQQSSQIHGIVFAQSVELHGKRLQKIRTHAETRTHAEKRGSAQSNTLMSRGVSLRVSCPVAV